MINHIHISGYKSIKKLTLDLTPINVLIGANGAGKSNLISFFKLLYNIYEQRLENYTLKKGPENLLYFGRKVTKHITGGFCFEEKDMYLFRLDSTGIGSLFISNERLPIYEKVSDYSENEPYNLRDWETNHYTNSNSKESRLKNSNDEIVKKVSDYLASFQVYHFHDTSDTSNLKVPSHINDNIILREDGGNLPSFLYFLQKRYFKHFKRIEQTIKSIAPYFERFELQPDRLNIERINLEWREINHPDTPFNARHLSDGTLRFIALVTLLMQPNLPKVIIIDEPELGLHPFAINMLSGLIKKASSKSQMIISTQSVDLVSSFDPEDIITVDRIENESVFNRVDGKKLKKWLDDFSLGELWLKNIIKGQPY